MTEWVLIIMLAARSTDAGVAVNSVRFKTHMSCEQAQTMINDNWKKADMGWPKPFVLCVEDGEGK